MHTSLLSEVNGVDTWSKELLLTSAEAVIPLLAEQEVVLVLVLLPLIHDPDLARTDTGRGGEGRRRDSRMD